MSSGVTCWSEFQGGCGLAHSDMSDAFSCFSLENKSIIYWKDDNKLYKYYLATGYLRFTLALLSKESSPNEREADYLLGVFSNDQ
jgi:hypothetical protein